MGGCFRQTFSVSNTFLIRVGVTVTICLRFGVKFSDSNCFPDPVGRGSTFNVWRLAQFNSNPLAKVIKAVTIGRCKAADSLLRCM
jgi:hypothetical protein